MLNSPAGTGPPDPAVDSTPPQRQRTPEGRLVTSQAHCTCSHRISHTHSHSQCHSQAQDCRHRNSQSQSKPRLTVNLVYQSAQGTSGILRLSTVLFRPWNNRLIASPGGDELAVGGGHRDDVSRVRSPFSPGGTGVTSAESVTHPHLDAMSWLLAAGTGMTSAESVTLLTWGDRGDVSRVSDPFSPGGQG